MLLQCTNKITQFACENSLQILTVFFPWDILRKFEKNAFEQIEKCRDLFFISTSCIKFSCRSDSIVLINFSKKNSIETSRKLWNWHKNRNFSFQTLSEAPLDHFFDNLISLLNILCPFLTKSKWNVDLCKPHSQMFLVDENFFFFLEDGCFS